MIDDSIVRGTTSRQIVQMLKDAGAKEVHVRINSPEVIWPCFYGIDTNNQNELIAARMGVEEIREYIGADSLAFLSLDGLLKALPSNRQYCLSCFNGKYPVEVPERFSKGKFREEYTPEFIDKTQPKPLV